MLTVLPLTNAGTRLMNDGCPPESIKWTNVFFVSCFFERFGISDYFATTLKTVPSTFFGGTGGLVS